MIYPPADDCRSGVVAVLASSAGFAVERLRASGFDAVRGKYLGPAPDLEGQLERTPVMTGNFAACRLDEGEPWRFVPLAKS